MRIITKELALVIAKKLGATMEKQKGPHDIWVIRHNGKMIANFGIRRGSNKELGHDHIPATIFLHPSRARALGQCTMLKEEWVQEMIDKGFIT
jgi:hypothetical protein